MKKTNSKEAEKVIKEIIFKFLDPKEYQVFIFGSRATEEQRNIQIMILE